jgi:hypothetical protein
MHCWRLASVDGGENIGDLDGIGSPSLEYQPQHAARVVHVIPQSSDAHNAHLGGNPILMTPRFRLGRLFSQNRIRHSGHATRRCCINNTLEGARWNRVAIPPCSNTLAFLAHIGRERRKRGPQPYDVGMSHSRLAHGWQSAPYKMQRLMSMKRCILHRDCISRYEKVRRTDADVNRHDQRKPLVCDGMGAGGAARAHPIAPLIMAEKINAL